MQKEKNEKVEGKKKRIEKGSKRMRVTLSEEAGTRFRQIKESLAARGLKDFDLSQVLDRALEKLGDGFSHEVIEEFTPLEYLLEQALKDSKQRKEIEKVLGVAGRRTRIKMTKAEGSES